MPVRCAWKPILIGSAELHLDIAHEAGREAERRAGARDRAEALQRRAAGDQSF